MNIKHNLTQNPQIFINSPSGQIFGVLALSHGRVSKRHHREKLAHQRLTTAPFTSHKQWKEEMVRKDGRGGADGSWKSMCLCMCVCVCVRKDGYISRNGSLIRHTLPVLPTP